MKSFTDEQKTLLRKAKPYAVEDEKRSVREVVASIVPFFALTTIAALADSTLISAPCSFIAGLVLMRIFCLYHDYMHGAILRNKKWASPLFSFFSILLLTPKNVWKETHNYHHTNNMRRGATHIGSYKIVTIEDWASMTPSDRRAYKATRHPATVFLGTLTVFFLGMMIAPSFRNIKKNYDGLIAVAVYLTVALSCVLLFGFKTYFFGILFPQIIAGGLGAYIFYAQHNFPSATLHSKSEWNHVNAAMESTVYIKMSPVMDWFSCNIGYHHIHHLNHKIPFYRLPEAMREVPEFAPKHITSLSFSDIKDNFSLKLWDDSKGEYTRTY